MKLKKFTLAITIVVTVKISRHFLFSTYITVHIRHILLQYLQLLLKCNVLKHLLNLLFYGIAFKGFYHTHFT